ncbi:phosphate acetyltransferase [Halomonas icarae]|uniref:Phosphate acetyltransferase n=1 Tax=Halomonas icarae TaxID=2691040 RepID=A0A7X4VW28_9GAMM|nr:phosphate acetyltransferase [Halomonas icarae]MDR5900971.1 phosphate acetyltransferase [Halomonas icarae]NAW11246.1 phosphate acetyltransferase [Halomonas icarae]
MSTSATRPEPRTLLLVPTGANVGLTSACLGLIRALDTLGLRAGFMRPFRQDDINGPGSDRSTALARTTLGLTPPEPLPQARLERLLRDDRIAELMEEAVARHTRVACGDEETCPDLVVVEGLVAGPQSSYAGLLNAELARALDARVILVADGDLDNPRQLAEQLDIHAQPFDGTRSARTLGCILMRVRPLPTAAGNSTLAAPELATHGNGALAETLRQHLPALDGEQFRLIGAVPWHDALSAPRIIDVARALDARFLHEGDAATRRVMGTSLCARSAYRALHVFKPGRLVVSPGDRDDILLAAALSTMNGVPLAGVLLTHGEQPGEPMVEICRPALRTGLPVLSVDSDSFETAKSLDRMANDIPIDDAERAEQVTRFVASHLDLHWLKATLSRGYPRRLSPAAFRHQLVQLAQQTDRRIVLPEGSEPRTVEAAVICQQRGIARCVLLGRREEIEEVARQRGIELPEGLEIIDPDTIRSRYVAPMVTRRAGKLNELTAEAQLQDNVVLGTMLLAEGEVDGLVSGAVHTTANTVRPAFQLIKTSPDYRQVSSIFFMLLPEQVVVYGDCAVNPDPSAETLAEIAIQSARSAAAFGIEPRVAMISYSTGESGSGADVEKVRQATRLARERAPGLCIDGPLQYDAAAIESVGRQKAPDSPVAGRATVFVFPDLNTGNTTYKAVQRSAHVVSVGPMLQGLNKPVNDLSRGALVDDIVYTIALTAIQATQPG